MFYISHKVLSHYEKIKLTVKSSKSQPLLIIAPVASLLLVALAVYLNLHPLLLLLLLLAQLLNAALTLASLIALLRALLCCLAALLLCKKCMLMRLQQTGVCSYCCRCPAADAITAAAAEVVRGFQQTQKWPHENTSSPSSTQQEVPMFG